MASAAFPKRSRAAAYPPFSSHANLPCLLPPSPTKGFGCCDHYSLGEARVDSVMLGQIRLNSANIDY